MYSKKMQYVIKSVPTDNKQALEDLLNEMSEQGWDLYTMHEIESDSSIDFNCIFTRERQNDDSTTDFDDLVNVTSFKHKMEKMLAAPTSPYESCKEIQLKISNQKDRIKRIKSQLESDNLSNDEKNRLNTQMSDELRQLDSLKQSLMNEMSPETMYSSLKEEKFTVNLSEEIIDLVSLEYNDGLLSETVKVRQKLTEELGYVIPHIHFHNGDDLGQNEFSIRLHDVETLRGLVFPNYIAYYKEDLKGYTVSDDDIVVVDCITGNKLVWINQEKTKDFWVKGLSAVEYIGLAIEHVSIKEVSDIMDYNDINRYVEIVLKNNSFLVDNIIPDFFTIISIMCYISSFIKFIIIFSNTNHNYTSFFLLL